MIIDSTYFQGTGLVKVPNISTIGPAGEAKLNELNAYSATFEAKLLKNVLGKDLYTAFVAGLLENPIPTRWTNLKNQLYNTTLKTSPVANYVFVSMWQKQQRVITESGDKSTNANNLTADANIPMIVQIWNEQIDMLIEFQEWFFENLSDYPEYTGCYIYSNSDYMNSIGL